MAKFYDSITEKHILFIEKQHLFFVSSAPLSRDGHVNLSPKGLDSFRVLSPNQVGYMDIVSSGNETSAHMLENGRITFMFCSFAENPLILRLFGTGFTALPASPEWDVLAGHFTILPSTRQLIVANISKVQTSCGFGVPRYEYLEERDNHFKWAEAKGSEGLAAYRDKNNLTSLDGLPTPLALQDQ